MHEVSLVTALVDQVEELARVQHFDRVLTIWLSVGVLSGVEPSCIAFCFSEVTRSSLLDGARLVMQRVDVELACRGCAELSCPSDPAALFCESCHSADVQVRKGQDFRIAELEVE
jgi:hydrogenase nickel incorporation protein HypA/HybF